jgi:hypothetical protein
MEAPSTSGRVQPLGQLNRFQTQPGSSLHITLLARQDPGLGLPDQADLPVPDK